MYKIYFLRHGKTIYNTLKLCQGTTNSNLTFKGKKQAKIVSNSICNLDFEYVFTGTLQRQIDTAKIVTNNFNNCKHIVDADFNEVCFGSFERKPIFYMYMCASQNNKAVKSYHTAETKLICDAIANADKSGRAENNSMISKRIERVLSKVLNTLKNNNQNSALVVSSGLFLQMIFYYLCPEANIKNIKNCVIYELTINDNKYCIKELQ